MATVRHRTDGPDVKTHGGTTALPVALPVRRSTRRGKALKAGAPAAAMTPAERAQRAYTLRVSGLGWSEIAGAMGYGHASSAYNAAMRYAVQVTPASQNLRDTWRPRALAQLDQLWNIIAPQLASTDEARRANALEQAAQVLTLYAGWLGCKPSETPAAAQLAEYGLAVIKE